MNIINNNCNNEEKLEILFWKVFRNIYLKMQIWEKIKIMTLIKKKTRSRFSGSFNEITMGYLKYREYLEEIRFTKFARIWDSSLFDFKRFDRDYPDFNNYTGIEQVTPIKPGTIPSTVKELHLELNLSLIKGSLPNSIKLLVICSSFDQILKPYISLPEGIETLYFSLYYNKPLSKGSLPSSLKKLYLGNHQSERIPPGVLNEGLLELNLNYSYNSPIEIGTLPKSLTTLQFSTFFDHIIPVGALGPNLKTIRLGTNQTSKLLPGVFPDSLEVLLFGRWNHPIEKGILPPNLQVLRFSERFNSIIEYDSLPSSLTYLSLGDEFNMQLPDLTSLVNLKTLKLGWVWDQSIIPNSFPNSLENLCLGKAFSQKIEPGTFSNCKSLSYLNISSARLNRDTLVKGSIPPSVKYLSFEYGYTVSDIENEIFPLSTLKFLSLGPKFDQPLKKELFNFQGCNLDAESYSLKTIIIEGFNQDLSNSNNLFIPNGVEKLEFGYYFKNPIPSNYEFPKSLTILEVGYQFSSPLNTLPDTIKYLKLVNKNYKYLESIPSSINIYLINQFVLNNLEYVKDLKYENILNEYHSYLNIPSPIPEPLKLESKIPIF